MPKTVTIVTFAAEVAKFYSAQLKKLFGELIQIKIYSFEDNTIEKISYDDANIVVVSTYSIYKTIKKIIPNKSEVVLVNTTLSRDAIKQIMSIPDNSKAMLVNLSAEMCIETISLIYQLGINHIELIPVYPGIKKIPVLELAITAGELRYVPQNVPSVIDIGHRILDTSTIVEIALKLNLEYLLHNHIFRNYFDSLETSNYSLETLAVRTNTLETQFDILLSVLDEGIIGVNTQGAIFAYNKSAEKIIGIKENDALGKDVKIILPSIPFDDVSDTLQPIKSKLIKINDVDINLNVYPVIIKDKFIGSFAIVQKFKDAEYQQHKLRLQLLNKGHRAKYSFKDIIGESPVIVKTKEIALKMSKTDASVLITGESGTGKELFAQAIHNSSNRKEYPFVAVNCAAIPENLLESELFGYEDGAFTGAKKGGKLGLFEFAHMGTLFLDEIEEMSLALQSKLLRVLQEKEVVRVGGDRVINVDVRIIAATNKYLKELIHSGNFRKDLYYRLNVLPLNIPPLRDRGQDILLIIDKIKKDLNSDFQLSKEIEEAFLNYLWEGNIRELRNYIEYLSYVSEDNITIDDLPFLGEIKSNSNNKINSDEHIYLEEFKKLAGDRMHEYLFVISQLAFSHKNRVLIGRRTIAKAAQEMNLFLTEQEIRNMLINLEKIKIVRLSKGRGGSKITELGLKILKNL